MAHYAFLDDNNIVTEVITGLDEGTDGVNWEEWYGNFRGQTCKQTSYNTSGNVHRLGGTPFRKNFAQPGYTYDEEKDAFISPPPFNSWNLNEDTCLWEPPVPYPTDGEIYQWDEENKVWIIVL
jgi:hypothetical protein